MRGSRAMKGAGAMEGFTVRRELKTGVWLEWGISLPLAAYQVAPHLGLPCRWGMVRGEAVLGKRTQSQITRNLQRERGRVMEIKRGRILLCLEVGAPKRGRGDGLENGMQVIKCV
jgi:hypothetical protein